MGGYNLGKNVKDATRHPPRTPQTPPKRTIAFEASPGATGSIAASPAEAVPDKSTEDGLIFGFWNWNSIFALEFGIVFFCRSQCRSLRLRLGPLRNG